MPFKVPDLPYGYSALEPYIDEETMHFHHDKHHAAYVNMLNGAVEAAKNLKGKSECNHEDIVGIFETALKTILERGKTKLGDKTIADSLNLIITNLKDNKNYSEVFKSATKKALEDFKGKKILIGRARMFEDKTKDLDDPGMLALNKLSEIF